MASLSLPRVLQLKKNSLDAEREQFEKFQTLAIQKAINAIETPVKEKHVRSTIIGTFQEQSAITYWMVAVRLPLQDNRIVAWKFCHVTHKLLREGHPACLDDSQRHIGMIENLGKLWVHLREGYGKLVSLYCSLLVSKLKFHARNPRFPGNMQLTADELDAIAENDVNNYFQLCVELFDYMDDILNLQAAVFDSLGNARANSMTASGQCRLAALIPCAQDSSQIYDCNVRLLFRLHASLPADTLAGHRERFRQQFKKLSSFYKHASSLQYYRNLLTLPVLPSNPPNFLLQSDFGTYVTPVVSIPEQPPDDVDAVGSLIDTSDTISQMTTPDQMEAFESRATPSPQPDPVVERDRLIDHLQNELRRMRNEVSERVEERNRILSAMREMSSGLESQLLVVKNELEQEKKRTQMLEVQTPEIKQKLAETEDKAKVTDEKFQKLKGAYTQLREEHINLIRQKAEVDKLTTSLRATAAQHESAKSALQQQLSDRIKDVELLQQSASASEEIEAYKSQLSNLRVELEQSRLKENELETLRASMEALEIEHKTTKTEQEEKLNTIANELKETKEVLDKIKQEKVEREKELSVVKEELICVREKSGDEYKQVYEEKEAALKQISELTQQYQQEKEEQILYINKFQTELENLQRKLIEAETTVVNKSDELREVFRNKSDEIENIINVKDIEIEEAVGKLQIFQNEVKLRSTAYDEKIKDQNNRIHELLEKVIDLEQCRHISQNRTQEFIAERDAVQLKLSEAMSNIDLLETRLSENLDSLSKYEKLLDETRQNSKITYKELENTKSIEISSLNDELRLKDDVRLELEAVIGEKNTEIKELLAKIDNLTLILENNNGEHDVKIKEQMMEIATLNDKFQTAIECKDSVIENLNIRLTDKDNEIVSLTGEVSKLTEVKENVEEELNESQAELEICKNEFLTLKEEFDNIVDQNDSIVALKETELSELNKKHSELCHEINCLKLEKQVFENNLKEKEEIINSIKIEKQSLNDDKDTITHDLNILINNLKSEYAQLTYEKENQIQSLNEQIEEKKSTFDLQMRDKDELLLKANSDIENLNIQLEELRILKQKEKEDMVHNMNEKDTLNQTLIAKLDISDNKRLTAESELQDLLQQNSVLEADIATLRIQLEEAKKEADKQCSRIMSCAGEAAMEVTQDAIAVFEGTQESSRAAADLAAKALEDLAKLCQVKGNEETVAKSAIIVAHITAQLSAYITELANVSTDIELSEKLHTECMSMLSSTKQCMESIKDGVVDSMLCAEARFVMLAAARSAAAADRPAASLSVDDELAGMDRAIEEAASQIEELLTASRASDSGVKLEVNGKILDACTTLMAAVKILVQDSRKLQNELGDPKTREKMYRKNPQWSEGLISASKAVVFAAKLLVSSADEAVGASGRVEGVSAAAHEVAGSTAQLVAASRARAPPASAALARLTAASRSVAAATGALVAAVRAASALRHDTEALDTSALTLTATRRLEMESKVRSLELESALDAERARLAALRKRHYQLAQQEENGNMTNGKE